MTAWKDGRRALFFLGFLGVGIAFGIVVAWVYAAIRPRFGHGAKPGVYAGLKHSGRLTYSGGAFSSIRVTRY